MAKYKAVIFDVGDTLVKWVPNYAAVYGDRLRSLGIAVDEQLARRVSDAVYRAAGEQSRREQEGAVRLSSGEYLSMLDRAALSCAPALPRPVDELVEQLEGVPLPQQRMTVIPGVHDLLGRLKAEGYRLGVVSNHWAWLLDFLHAEKLSGYFETIIVSELVGVEKPNVHIMELALEQLNLPAADCLYVGDQEMDVLCAKRAGMDMAWIAPAEAALSQEIVYREDYRIESVLEIEVFL